VSTLGERGRAETNNARRPLPLAAAWLRGSRGPARDAMLSVLEARLRSYARGA